MKPTVRAKSRRGSPVPAAVARLVLVTSAHVAVLAATAACGGTSPSAGAAGTSAGGISSAGATGIGGTTATGGSGGGRSSGGTPGVGGTSTSSGGASGTGGANTGGASTGGASTGSGGAPHTVGKCDSLAGVGVWENITPAGVSGVNAFAVSPVNPAIVYLATQGIGVFKTTDCGSGFARIDDGNSKVQGPSQNGSWTMEADPTNSDVVWMNNGYGDNGVYKTTNGGVHWTQIITPEAKAALQYGGFVENIAIDWTDPRHVTVTPHFACEAPYTSGCLVETTDGGTTWKVVQNTPGGAEGYGQVMITATTWYWAVPFGGLWRTTNAGAHWTEVSTTGTNYRFPVRTSDGHWYFPSLYGVQTSSDGISWSKLANGPKSDSLVEGNGVLYTSLYPGGYWSAPLSSPTNWTQITAPAANGGAWLIRYDPDHDILYATGHDAFWRVRMK